MNCRIGFFAAFTFVPMACSIVNPSCAVNVGGIGAVGFKIAENSVKSSTYDAYLVEAENLASTDWDKCVEYYENAITL